jgi:hypothetical protein
VKQPFMGNKEFEFITNVADTDSIKNINDGLSKIELNIPLRVNSTDKDNLQKRGFSIVYRDGDSEYDIVDSEHPIMKPIVRDLKIKQVIA